MHIEPGVVTGAKLILSYGTAASAGVAALAAMAGGARREGIGPILFRSALATGIVFAFFELLPHWPVGVSEVHLILGSTLFLVFGAAPASVGLAAGLLIQGLFFAPFDLPQYGMNVTTLLVPLYAVAVLADRIIAPSMPYTDLRYGQVLVLSFAYQGGVVAWVAFWALYGQGFAVENLTRIGAFGASYLLVVTLEPLVDLTVLGIAKATRTLGGTGVVARRVYVRA